MQEGTEDQQTLFGQTFFRAQPEPKRGTLGKRIPTNDILEFLDLLKLGQTPIPPNEQKKVTLYESLSSPFFDPGSLSMDDDGSQGSSRDALETYLAKQMAGDYEGMSEKLKGTYDRLRSWGVDCIPLSEGRPSLQIPQLGVPQPSLSQESECASLTGHQLFASHEE
ncbi:unnamed protein product [Darwinula stevensoni]|uniref:Uncharacterized protein n=1 Tax=Darwinula stevensoni TaxID=69355 RepID=A0A7R8X7H6_9CRUS|nr:unnamed protein product [Darwinula stevensoni]CAG0883310.1 unnamed protein product [Darwinula stevensoni]